MKIFVDIDNTICKTEGLNYKEAQPIVSRINEINSLYDDGHEIHYWTARGSVTNMDWYELTFNQLKEWGAKFHQLKLGKPPYDLFICDKAVNSEDFFNI